MNGGLLDLARIRANCGLGRIGRILLYRRETASTNDDARACVEDDALDGAMFLAEHQTRGRGRLGRPWQAPHGSSLLASTLLIDRGGAFLGYHPSLATAVAVCEAIAAALQRTPTIKWPNDILLRGRKLAGILVESRLRRDGARAYVVGVGINCLQQRGHFEGVLAEQATSLDLEGSEPVDRSAVAIELIRALDHWLNPAARDAESLRAAYLKRSDTIGRRLSIRHNGRAFTGTVLNLDPEAALVLQLDEGGVRLFHSADSTVVTDG